MICGIEFLEVAIDTIKLSIARKGENITEEEIVRKAGLQLEQLEAFLLGKEKKPDDFDVKLLSLYGIKRKTMQFIDPFPHDMPPNFG